jgi:alpha-tubulin suppressor-like RCC1 family protein
MSSTAQYDANVSITGTLTILSSNLQANIVSGNVSTRYTQYVQGKTVACGDRHTVILLSNGTVRACGGNINGQLGDNTSGVGNMQSTVVPVIGVTGAIAVAGGLFHTAILLSDGTVRTCGLNSSGQLGDGTATSTRSTTVQVQSVSTAIAVACGVRHTAIVLRDGTVRACGENIAGQLGDNTTSRRSTTVQVSGVSTAIAVACGRYHTAIVLNDGTVRACGFNSSGEIGDGTSGTYRSTTVQVTSVSTAVAVACGLTHTAILLSDGTVRTCGLNSSGQLGDGTTSTRLTTVQVQSVSTAIAVACGGYHTAILLSSGAVRACGFNLTGQLGDNTTSNRSTVVTVIGVTGAIAVAGGFRHTAILLRDGTVRACGGNGNGELGDGTTSTRSTVVPVLNIPFNQTANLIVTSNIISVPQLNLGLTNPSFQLDLSTDTARKLTTSTWTTGSDESLKTNIELADLDRCVDIISKIDLKYFKWEIPSDDSHSLGWIAQEVEQIFPKAVRVAEAHGIPDFKNLDSDQIIKVMWGALKKLRVDLKAKRLY